MHQFLLLLLLHGCCSTAETELPDGDKCSDEYLDCRWTKFLRCRSNPCLPKPCTRPCMAGWDGQPAKERIACRCSNMSNSPCLMTCALQQIVFWIFHCIRKIIIQYIIFEIRCLRCWWIAGAPASKSFKGKQWAAAQRSHTSWTKKEPDQFRFCRF